MKNLRALGVLLVFFSLVMPLDGATIGALLAWAVGLSLGGATLLAGLGAGASSIAAPMRMAGINSHG